MVLPIVAYGDPVLKKVGEDIDKDYPGLEELIANMFETMYNARGVGLAAPQIGRAIRLFVIDASPFDDEDESVKDFKRVFINPEITEEEGEEWYFNEGCLSIPDVREDVARKPKLKISYYDENFKFHEEELDGIAARVVQHEYDHIEGILFTEYLSPLKKRMIKGKLNNIMSGKISVEYRMRFPSIKKKR